MLKSSAQGGGLPAIPLSWTHVNRDQAHIRVLNLQVEIHHLEDEVVKMWTQHLDDAGTSALPQKKWLQLPEVRELTESIESRQRQINYLVEKHKLTDSLERVASCVLEMIPEVASTQQGTRCSICDKSFPSGQQPSCRYCITDADGKARVQGGAL